MDMETNLPEEEETSILTLTDENGQDVDFEYLDCIEYQGTEYLVLMPEGEDEIVIKSMCALCLSYDHRIIDGAEAAKFLQKVKSYLQNPVLLI